MWELDCEESWALKNWCFWTVVLEKGHESPMDCKEIQPVHSNEISPGCSLEGMMLKLKLQYFGHLMQSVDSLEKTLMLGGIGGRRRRGRQRMASPTQWTWIWVNSGSWWWTGRPGVLQFMGSQRFGHNWAINFIHFKGFYVCACTYTQLNIMEQCKSYQIILLKSLRQEENKILFFITEVLGWKKWGKENIDRFHLLCDLICICSWGDLLSVVAVAVMSISHFRKEVNIIITDIIRMSISLMYHIKKKAKVEKNETSKGVFSPVPRTQCSFAQLCLTLCDPRDCRLPGSSVHGIFQAIILKQVAIACFRGSSQPRDWTQVCGASCTGWQSLYCWATWEAWIATRVKCVSRSVMSCSLQPLGL